MKRVFQTTIATLVLAMGISLPLACTAQILHSGVALPASVVSTYEQATSAGELRGTTENTAGAPITEVQIVLTCLDDQTNRTLVSDDRGIFVLEGLKPGRYQLAANKNGFASPQPTTLEIPARQSVRVDLRMAANKSTALVRSATPVGSSEAADETPDPLVHRPARLHASVSAPADPAAVPATGAPNPASASTSSAPASTEAPDAIEKELQTMAARIVELETELKARDAATSAPASATASTATQISSQMAATTTVSAPAGVGTATNTSPASSSASAQDNKPAKIEPFSDWDWTWLNGNPRTITPAFDSKFFTPEIRADLTYTYDFNKPVDNSMGGSSELFRSNELQLEQLGIGGDFHYDNVRARFMTQFGMYSTATIRNDPSYQKGQWNIDDADRYLSEAYGGYHLNYLHGINIDAGIFMSYIGLFSYYNFDNWAYQPSYVSSNTPWFFQGVRIQIFPTAHLKIEPWFINGWQSYASSNSRKGIGGQIKWTPYPWMNIISNNYGLGHDDLYTPHRGRIHTDDSIEIKYYDKPMNTLDKMAFSFTGDLGCEFGEGVNCHNDHNGNFKQSFIGYMIYNRFWFHKDLFGLTLGGGQINNPGRYLVLIPPINGETAGSAAINSPYFSEAPGSPFKAWDSSVTFDYMPRQYLTFRVEGDYRHANVDYWSGPGGVTPPTALGAGTWANNGDPIDWACMDGSSVPAVGVFAQTETQAAAVCSGSIAPPNGTAIANHGGLWTPDLRKDEMLIDIDVLVKF